MSILGKITGLDAVRDEMKQRVDEILKAGNEWKIAAEKLAQTIQTLTQAIEKGEKSDLTPIKGELKKLNSHTMRLARAFEAHMRTLETLSRKL
jgi:ribosome-binding protein aMBF1 (putative translation factor)